MAGSGLSDKGIAVFAFAAYHQLTSGEPVMSVVQADGKGHEADPQAVQELTAAGLAEAKDGRISFTAEGLKRLEAVIAGLRQSAA